MKRGIDIDRMALKNPDNYESTSDFLRRILKVIMNDDNERLKAFFVYRKISSLR